MEWSDLTLVLETQLGKRLEKRDPEQTFGLGEKVIASFGLTITIQQFHSDLP
jgi:hypothetical protein